ncbi:hypothetical protein TWF730_001905 [Orbilia blumenaviensis]|uniref:Uncharacterized protein n=1 Tax=Orbilia blumenaviensis TaxID=1796055 RepID=A0AAV9UD33_9PEZI
METLQKLSRESLRLNAAPQPPPPGPIIYETSKQVKKAYSKRKGNVISEAERKRIERIKVLDERAEKIRQKEVRKKENALKRKAKEEKAGGPVGKRIARITSSQPELSKFFVAKKGGVSSGPVKRGLDYSVVEVEVGREEPEGVANVEVSEGEEEEVEAVEEEEEVEKSEVKSNALAEKPIDDGNVPAVSPTLVEENEVESFAMGQKATMKLYSQLALLPPSSGPKRPTAGRLTECASFDDANLLSSSADGLPDALLREIPKSSPPQPIYAQDPPSEPAEEQAEAEREENERILEILREETDYNDFDDDYDLEDDPGFDYDYAEGPTSPAVCEAEDETTYGDGELDITSSDEAYGMGLSDPAFDELHDAFCEHEEVHAEESEQGFDSSFLCQAFEDDLRELEEDF